MRLITMAILAIICMLEWTLSCANLPYVRITFPRDHGGHFSNIPYSYKHMIEWWYFNGKATDDTGRRLSFDVAFFHPALKQVTVITLPYLHLQVADLDAKMAYGAQKKFPYSSAYVSTQSLDIMLPQAFELKSIEQDGKVIYKLKAEVEKEGTMIRVDLMLEPRSEPFLINGNGLLQEPENTNTYYYTIPTFSIMGNIQVNQHQYVINVHKGEAWMDHQWGDFLVDHYGWEWFSVRLNNGLFANIMLSYDFAKQAIVDGLASIILPNGDKRFIPYSDFTVTRDSFWFDDKLKLNFPMVFHFNFPALQLTFDHVAVFPQQEFHGYWEGYCQVTGQYGSAAVHGFSYAELVYKNPAQLYAPLN